LPRSARGSRARLRNGAEPLQVRRTEFELL